MSDFDELSELAKQLDPASPSESRVEVVRAQLLRAAVEDRHEVRTRWPFVAGGFTAGAFAAAAAAMLVMHHGQPMTAPVASEHGNELRAQIEASSAADFERQITHSAKGTDEIVRLHAGRISLAVNDLPRGDHVRVTAKNGEIEGAGLYEVAVVDDAIQEVIVKEGGANVRITGQQNVFLATGQAWKAPVITADVTPSHVTPPVIATAVTAAPAIVETKTLTPTPTHRAPEMIRTPTPTHTSITEPSPIEKSAPAVPVLQTMAASPGESPPAAITQVARPEKKTSALEQHFAAGWQLLRAGKDADAARELAAAADAGGDDPLAGDARYFQAIALTKAGRKTEAEHALVSFLDRSPHALRRGRAAVMLGRLIAERGDPATAKTWFESASHDPDPNVASAAQAELAKSH